ncbi:protein O-GlcNAcase [Teleopsis dalmanni]|uniref:protein O-GlcNAcase n=1 Tax=Teleopsis dalmanni TaxID=139649 RepID=UPI0018CCA0B5|nr:protein O-GlcNAcase [Teleopsis dalmanni]
MEDSIEKCTQPEIVKNNKKNFICGVIEGFYGRPWTMEQRKDLFRKLKKWGMDSYVYAPKDDYKHRAYWRELYTVEEADHLSSLISAAKEHDVVFYYALSPGLDMTYSSQKEIQTLKRKLDQVSQFGCEAFALLFDDIEAELSKVDKEVFQTFGNAQVSVTNEVYTHLGNPKFFFCPTQYCSSRAIPTLHDSEYLNTLGSKLNHDIDIMWTGNKVISKIITLESIQEITEILRRPPVIWDNLHANDYDQKRVFLGPYSGRSPELIPHLRGVMTNPNCEFHANTIAIHSLAHWSKCSMDSKVNSCLADIKLETENEDGISSEEPTDCRLSKNIYHPRIALKSAIAEWLPEFFIEKEAWGPISKPQPQVTMVLPIIPIIPSINTCMSLSTTTTTSTNTKTATVPEVNTTQLRALADVCSTVNSSAVNPISNPVMNSLVSPTKVVTNDDILNPITSSVASAIELPKTIPISVVSVPIMHAKTVEDVCQSHIDNEQHNTKENTPLKTDDICTEIIKSHMELSEVQHDDDSNNKNNDNFDLLEEKDKSELLPIISNLEEDVIIDEKPQDRESASLSTDIVNMTDENNLSPISTGNEPMECSSSQASQTPPKDERKINSEDIIMAETTSTNECNSNMQIESSESSPISNADMKDEEEKILNEDAKIKAEDLFLLCDLFYLPFEHGSRGIKLLNEFNWLKTNANVLCELKKSAAESPKPEVVEWLQRAEAFSVLCDSVQDLLKKVANCANKEICHDLFSYIWDIGGALILLNAFVKWLSQGHFPPNICSFTQGSFTWFSKGWKETFQSGDQEPWVFRGGLTADLQRLMPVDSGNDLFLYKLPELPTTDCTILRPYTNIDEIDVYKVCTKFYLTLGTVEDENIALPEKLCELISDSLVGSYITLSPEFCTIAFDSSKNVIGYAAAAVDIKQFVRKVSICWLPAMQEKYPKSVLDNSELFSANKKFNNSFTRMINDFHNSEYECPKEVSNTYSGIVSIAVLKSSLTADHALVKRLLTVTLANLRANGCFGVHVRLSDAEQVQYYLKAGFQEIFRDPLTKELYLGRRF